MITVWQSCGAGALGCGVVLLAVAGGCGYFADLAGPVPQSSGDVEVVLRDAVFATGVAGARVWSARVEASTNAEGICTLRALPTGMQELFVVHERFSSLDTLVNVSREMRTVILDLERRDSPPEIDTLYFFPNPTCSRDDTVRAVFSVHDSGARVAGVRLDWGDGATSYRTYSPPRVRVLDTLTRVYTAPGFFLPQLVVHASEGDSVVAQGEGVRVRVNYAPRLAGNIEVDSFFTGREGYLLFDAFDPDGYITKVIVDWGDGAADTTAAVLPVYWHTYSFAEVTYVWITIILHDNEHARSQFRLRVRVRALTPPRLGAEVVFNPIPPLTPLHDSVRVGVLVREVESHVSSITWALNEGGASVYRWQSYGEEDGSVTIPLGTTFYTTIPTMDLAAENVVRIRVTDTFALWSEVTATFSILGK